MKIVITETQLRRVFLKEDESEKLESIVFNLLDTLLNNYIVKRHDLNENEIIFIKDNHTAIFIKNNSKDVIITSYFLYQIEIIIPIGRDLLFPIIKKWVAKIIKNRTESNKVSDAIKKRDGLTI